MNTLCPCPVGGGSKAIQAVLGTSVKGASVPPGIQPGLPDREPALGTPHRLSPACSHHVLLVMLHVTFLDVGKAQRMPVLRHRPGVLVR